MDADTELGVALSGVIARHQFTTDPGPVIEELRAVAGGRADVLAREAGIWAGFHEHDEHKAVLVAALRSIPGAEAWVRVGRERSGRGRHENP